MRKSMNLPEEYLSWIESVDTNREHIYKRSIIIDFYSKSELKVKHESASKFFHEKVFVNNIKEINAEVLDANDIYSFTKERTDRCITIGESNSNYIFVDPFDSFSIWIVILGNQCVFKEKGNIYDIVKYSHLYKA